MQITIKKNWPYLAFILVCIMLDQCSKIWCQAHITYQERRVLIPHFLDLTLVYNKGVAFSLFTNQEHLLPYFIMLLAINICGYLLHKILHNTFNSLQKIAGSLIISGAIGNILDRLIQGRVIDFILVYYRSFSWPVFNIADSLITIGAFLFILENLTIQRRRY